MLGYSMTRLHVLFVLLLNVLTHGALRQDDLLLQHLLSNYSASGVAGFPNPVNVSVGIALKRIQDLDQIKGIATSNVWLRMFWRDMDLTWNPADWGGITVITAPTEERSENAIWVPDLVPYNTGENPLESMYPAHAQVYSDGSVSWSRPGIIRSAYSPKLDLFPYDTQTVRWVFGSWAYDSAVLKLSIHPSGLDTSVFDPPPEWEFMSSQTELHSALYECCPNPFEDATFTVVLRRYPTHYVEQSVVPGFALAIVSWGSFFMDRIDARPARTSIVMISMLAQITLRGIVSSKVPVSSSASWLERMQLYLMLFNMVALGEWVLVQYLANVSKWRPQAWEPSSTHHWASTWFQNKNSEHLYTDLRARLNGYEADEGESQEDETRMPLKNKQSAHIIEMEQVNPYFVETQEVATSGYRSDVQQARGSQDVQRVTVQQATEPRANAEGMFPTCCTARIATGQDPLELRAYPVDPGVCDNQDDDIMHTSRDSDRSQQDQAEMKAHKDWEKIRFEASIQDEIKKRRSAYGVHSDGPGPQLAKKLDQFFRTAFFVALMVLAGAMYYEVV